MKSKWPLHGNFLRFHLEKRKNETHGKKLAEDLGIDPSTLSRLSSGNMDVTEYEDKYRNHLLPTGLTVQKQTMYWVSFKDSYCYLRALENQIGVDLAPDMPGLAEIYLKEQKLISDDRIATIALVDWKRRRIKNVTSKRSSDLSTDLENNDSTPHSQKKSSGSIPENHVAELCELGAIITDYRSETNVIEVVYSLTFGFTLQQFGDLVARCGLNAAQILTDFSGITECKYYHHREPLKGRLARQRGTHEFVIKQTSAGAPEPFLLDSVFEEAPIFTAELCKDVSVASIRLNCSIEFPDLRVEAYTADGEKFPNLSDEQKVLRKKALELFILDRCKSGGFRGTLGTACWCTNDRH